MSEEATVVSGEEDRGDGGGTGEGQADKPVPTGEVIGYRVRAQAAEKELSELKELYEKQGQELAELKGQIESSGDLTPAVNASCKTQGVKESRAGGSRAMLEGAARRAAESGSRADIQEYLRARRRYV
jgi:hypothetical protein